MTIRNRLTPEIVAERLAPRGIKLIGEFRRGALPATFEAACGHRWRVTAASVINSQSGCPICALVKSHAATRREMARYAGARK